jgi:hypothetical protein
MTAHRAKPVVLVAVVGLALAGCSDDGGQAATPPSSTSSTPTPAETTPTAAASTPIDGHSVTSVAQVIDAFQQAKLPVRKPRDNSDNCESQQLGCIQLTTTDDVSVYSFATIDDAKAFATVYGTEAYTSGNVVLSYGAARTPAALRPRYQKILDGLK